jgi:hypothetical protein
MPLYTFEVRRRVGNIYAGRLTREAATADAALARAAARAAQRNFSLSDQREIPRQPQTPPPDGYLVFSRA